MQLPSKHNRIWLLKAPTDLRRGIDGLCHLVTQEMQLSATAGFYIFYNKKRDKLKCLWWHKNGFILLCKRLEKHRFHMLFKRASGKMNLTHQELEWLFAGLDWQLMRNWKELDYKKFS